MSKSSREAWPLRVLLAAHAHLVIHAALCVQSHVGSSVPRLDAHRRSAWICQIEPKDLVAVNLCIQIRLVATQGGRAGVDADRRLLLEHSHLVVARHLEEKISDSDTSCVARRWMSVTEECCNDCVAAISVLGPGTLVLTYNIVLVWPSLHPCLTFPVLHTHFGRPCTRTRTHARKRWPCLQLWHSREKCECERRCVLAQHWARARAWSTSHAC